MVQRVKAAQKERDSLQGDKEAAEEYLAKERECMGAQSELAQVLAAKAKVRRAGWGSGTLMGQGRVETSQAVDSASLKSRLAMAAAALKRLAQQHAEPAPPCLPPPTHRACCSTTLS